MKKKYTFIYTIFGLFAFSGLFFNSSTGQKGSYSGAPGDQTCANSSCHIDNAHDPNGGVRLTGAPANFTAGVSYPLTLTLTHAGGVGGGFQIVATNNAIGNNVMYGSFVPGAGTKISSTVGTSPNRLMHNAPKSFTMGVVSWTFNWVAPVTGSGVRFYYAANASDINNDETTGDVIYNSTQLTIPVELMSFSGQSAEKSVKLTWETASERNNRVFEIERNIVGSTNRFEKIGEVKGLANSSSINTYTFSDDAPQADNINYYRLRQVDFDGTSTFSKVISIGLKATNKGFRLYPNFVNQGSDIQIETGNNEAITFDIIDISGKIIQSIKKAQNTEGVKISTSGLPTGRYFMRSIDSFSPQTAVFIVF
jgi:Secretion system C-terminal sorting domain